MKAFTFAESFYKLKYHDLLSLKTIFVTGSLCKYEFKSDWAHKT